MNDEVAAFENGPGYKTAEEDCMKHRGVRGQNKRKETPKENNGAPTHFSIQKSNYSTIYHLASTTCNV